MKPYTVIWEDPAIDEMAVLWESASDRTALSKACNRIDALLAAIGEQAGTVVSPEGCGD